LEQEKKREAATKRKHIEMITETVDEQNEQNEHTDNLFEQEAERQRFHSPKSQDEQQQLK
jgi:hypothetical protein